MKTVSIIRNRGQLTIPDSIRRIIPWISPMSAVSISVIQPNEIVIRPNQFQRDTDWDKLWAQIKRVRTFKGNGRGNISAFIAEDRVDRR